MNQTEIRFRHDAVRDNVFSYRAYISASQNGPWDRYIEGGVVSYSGERAIFLGANPSTIYVRLATVANDGSEVIWPDVYEYRPYDGIPTSPTDARFVDSEPSTPEPDIIDVEPLPEQTPDQDLDPFDGMMDLASRYGRIIDSTRPSIPYAQTTPYTPVENLINGRLEPESRWSIETLRSGTTFAEIDLSAPVMVSGFVLHTLDARAYKFRIAFALDRADYKTIADFSTNMEPGPISLIFPREIQCRYVRIQIIGAHSYTGSWASLINLSIYGQPVELDIPVPTPIPDPVGIPFKHPGGLNTKQQIDRSVQAAKSPGVVADAFKGLTTFATARLAHAPKAVAVYSVPLYHQNATGHQAAKNIMQQDMWSAYSCGAMYALIGATGYAQTATRILKNWASVNKVISLAEDSYLVTCYVCPGLLQAAEFISDYDGWNPSDRERFRQWCGSVLREPAKRTKFRSWIELGPDGNYWVAEWVRKSNSPYLPVPGYLSNHNFWGILASIQIAHFIDDWVTLEADTRLLKFLIGAMIMEDGRMPSELNRGSSSINYTAFALEACTAAVETIRNCGGENLYNWAGPTGGSVKKALEFLFDKGIENPNLWPIAGAKDSPLNPGHTHELFAAMGRVYGIKKWIDWAKPPIPDLETGVGFALPTLFEPDPV